MFRSSLPLVLAFSLLPLCAQAAETLPTRDIAPVVSKMAQEEGSDTITLNEQDRLDLKRVEEYFNALPPLAARFTQTSQQLDGNSFEAQGQFKLWRPGRLRIDYDAPNKDFVVADGKIIYQWDDQMRQQSQTGIDETLAGFILKRNLNFSGDDVTVTAVTHPTAQSMEVTLRSVKQPESGELTLTLDDVPLRLTGWRVKDGQGLITSVALGDVQQNATMKKEDFTFRNPDFSKRH